MRSIAAWCHDRAVTEHLLRGTFPLYEPLALRDFRAMAESEHDVELAVMALEPETFVGVAGLHSIHWIARSAEFRILLGERAFWGRGIGTEVAQLVSAYGFELLNLHKVWLGVNDDNLGARRSYDKAGFTAEGVLRDEVFRNGTYHHVTRMSMLEHEYRRQRSSWPIAALLDDQFPPSR